MPKNGHTPPFQVKNTKNQTVHCLALSVEGRENYVPVEKSDFHKKLIGKNRNRKKRKLGLKQVKENKEEVREVETQQDLIEESKIPIDPVEEEVKTPRIQEKVEEREIEDTGKLTHQSQYKRTFNLPRLTNNEEEFDIFDFPSYYENNELPTQQAKKGLINKKEKEALEIKEGYSKTLKIQFGLALLTIFSTLFLWQYAIKPLISMIILLVLTFIPLLVTIFGLDKIDQIGGLLMDLYQKVDTWYHYYSQPPSLRELANPKVSVNSFLSRIQSYMYKPPFLVRPQKKLKDSHKQFEAEKMAADHIQSSTMDNGKSIYFIPSRISNVGNDPDTKAKLLVNSRILDVVNTPVQLDTGSQVSLINKRFFNKVKKAYTGKIKYLSPEKLLIKGIGSSMEENTSPVVFKFQIGRCSFQQRLVVTEALDCPVLLGLDAMRAHSIFFKPDQNNQIVVTIGDFQNPITTVPTISNQSAKLIKLSSEKSLKPFEESKVSFSTQGMARLPQHTVVFRADNSNGLPVRIYHSLVSPGSGKLEAIVKNFTPYDVTIPEGWHCGTVHSRCHSGLGIDQDPTLIRALNLSLENRDIEETLELQESNVLNTNKIPEKSEFVELEMLESPPGYEFTPNDYDQEVELQKILTNEQIPSQFRQDLFQFLKEKTPGLVSANEFDIGNTNLIEYDIDLIDGATPVAHKPYRSAGIRLSQLKDAVDKLEKAGIIEEGPSNWAFPCALVTKSPDSQGLGCRQRLIINLRGLNSVTKRNQFPLKRIDSLLHKVSGSRFFTSLDIRSGFNSIRLTKKAQDLASFVTPWGQYRCLRLPFGLTNGPSVFSQLMHRIFKDDPFVITYMDDLLVLGKTQEENYENLKYTLKKLYEAGLKIIPSKGTYFKTHLKWLGQIIDGNGRRPDPKKIEIIKQMPEPSTVKELQRFLGFLAYQCIFIKNYSEVTSPLTELLKQKIFCFPETARKAFENIKSQLTENLMLFHPDFSKSIVIQSDASNTSVGAIAYQCYTYKNTVEDRKKILEKWGLTKMNQIKSAPKSVIPLTTPGKNTPPPFDLSTGREVTIDQSIFNDESSEENSSGEKKIIVVCPLQYFSKKFSTDQQKGWTILEKECCGILLSLTNFADLLWATSSQGVENFLCTDSQPLVWLLRFKDGSNAKLTRWILTILSFPFKLIVGHCAGKKLTGADYLSRIWTPSQENDAEKLDPKKAIFVKPAFPVGSIITTQDIFNALERDPNLVSTEPFESDIIEVNSKCCSIKLGKDNPPFNPSIEDIWMDRISFKVTVEKVEREVFLLEKGPRYGLSLKELSDKLTHENLIELQKMDPALRPVRRRIEEGDNTIKYYLFRDLLMLPGQSGQKEDKGRIVVPSHLTSTVLALYHMRQHMGKNRLFSAISATYFWPHMMEDIGNFCKACMLCAEQKVTTIGPPPMGNMRFFGLLESWQIDIVEGLRPFDGMSALVNCIETFSGYIAPFPISNKKSAHIGEKFETHVISKFGSMQIVSCDNALSFTSASLKAKLGFYGTKISTTTRYSPRSHALIENSNRNLQLLMRILGTQLRYPWPKVLPIATMMLNVNPRIDLGNRSSYEILFGKKFEWPEKYFENNEDSIDADRYIEQVREIREAAYEAVLKLKEYRQVQAGKHVSYERPMPPGTLVLLRDLRTLKLKKTLERYFRPPTIVITEYPNTVIHQSLDGRIMMDSKRNLKICSERTKKLFENLSPEIKTALGGVFTKDNFQDYFLEQELPPFLREHPEILDEMQLNEADELGELPDERPDILGNNPVEPPGDRRPVHQDQIVAQPHIDIDPPQWNDLQQGPGGGVSHEVVPDPTQVTRDPVQPDAQTNDVNQTLTDRPISTSTNQNPQQNQQVTQPPADTQLVPTRGLGSILSNMRNVTRYGLRKNPAKKVKFDL